MIRSKLPDVGTTIFTVMSHRARELGALNIGQGFPDYPIDPRLAELVHAAMLEGHNQYAPMEGLLELRRAISDKLRATYHVTADPESEITITLGATEALFSTIQALIGPGDEAIVFDPAYDSYEPAVRLAGGRCIRIPLDPPVFAYDFDRVRVAVTERTRLVIFNNPANPACTAATAHDVRALAALACERGLYMLSDEVYEHVVFDGRPHVSVLSIPELRERSVTVFSFGKTLHATGWRVGYAVACEELTRELRKVHQFNTFSIANPLQVAIARFLRERPDAWQGLAAFFQGKRDLLRVALDGTGFELPAAQGTYFQLLGYRRIADEDDVTFADRLIREAGVATIPLSPFYRDPPPSRFVRLCIAKRDDTLRDAATRLAGFAAGRRGSTV
jgi:methionine aminotransferase